MNEQMMHLSLLLVTVTLTISTTNAADRSFTIDYEHDTFLKDGQPIQIVSGSIHYFRVHPTDWADRLYKLRYAGFNAVETYIEWAGNEPEPGQYDLSGLNNFTAYLEEAQRQDLLVILRPGPFISAQRDLGGLPYWLLRENPDMVLRTSDPTYLKYVDKWMGDILLPMLKPYLYSEGGPVVLVQVGNEYGWYDKCDCEYTSHLRDLFRASLGDDVVLFTNDGHESAQLRCGKIPQVYATVDFDTSVNASEGFHDLRLFEPHGPLMNAESYPGWYDAWGCRHSTLPTQIVTDHLDSILAMGAAINFYMFLGGTTFGLTTGTKFHNNSYTYWITSYDYDAPLSEAGDLTLKYLAIRDVVGKYLPLPDMTTPTNSTKTAYGDVAVKEAGKLLDLAAVLPSANSEDPLTFEVLKLYNGITVYETIIGIFPTDPAVLECGSVSDRGYVYLDGELIGLLDRGQTAAYTLPMRARTGQKLTMLVESMGRILDAKYGLTNEDIMKGIIGGVKLGGKSLANWTNTAVDLTKLNKLEPTLHQLTNLSSAFELRDGQLIFYNGSFTVDEPNDTFLRLDGWNKGIAYINGFCLGRYWPVMGPQLTLYVPHGLLNTGDNAVTLLELEGAPCGNTASCKVTFTDKPVIDGPAPNPPVK